MGSSMMGRRILSVVAVRMGSGWTVTVGVAVFSKNLIYKIIKTSSFNCLCSDSLCTNRNLIKIVKEISVRIRGNNCRIRVLLKFDDWLLLECGPFADFEDFRDLNFIL